MKKKYRENRIWITIANYNEIVNQLILTLVSYSNNREEFDKYTLKIKNKLAYFNITLNYVLNFFEDISLN